jgi:hypothetical protein
VIVSRKTTWLNGIVAVLCGIVLGTASLQIASAGIFGSYTNFTAGTKSCKARSEVAISLLISENKDVGTAATYIQTTDGTNVAAGYMGVKATLYKYNGSNSYTYLGSSTLYFNSSSTSSLSNGYYEKAVVGITYDAEVYVEAYNPSSSSYVPANTSRTANLSY